jgi:hypothetical protein
VRSSYIEFAAGRDGRVDGTDSDGRHNGIYLFTDGDGWYSLDCRSFALPDDRWRSIAETIEFLTEDE